MSWIFEEHNQVLYFISDNFEYRPNIAIFSFNNTLVNSEMMRTKVNNMHLFSDSVIPTLDKINEQGSLIIMDNLYKVSDNTAKLLTGKFLTLINMPFIIMFSLADNKFRKPFTHMFEKLKILYKVNADEEISIDTSLVIGNNAGRVETNIFKKDLYDYDRAFAHNIGTKFVTQSHIFLNDLTPRGWKWNIDFDINNLLEEQKKIKEPHFNTIIDTDNIRASIPHIIFIGGPPTSGKSMFSNRIKSYIKDILGNLPNNTETVSLRSKIANQQNNYFNVAINKINSIFETNNNLIVVDLFSDIKKLIVFLTAVSKLLEQQSSDKKIKCIYIEMDAKKSTCEFLDRFRVQISKQLLELTSKNEFYKYYKTYKPFEKKVAEINSYFGTLNIKYHHYPLILRTKPEIYYHY